MKFHAQILPDNKFKPIDSEDFKKSLKLRPGDYVDIETWKERNLLLHKKYFAFLNTVIYFLPENPEFDKLRNIDYLRKEIMVLIGEVDFRFTMTGEKCIEVRSISFKSMDNERFEWIYSASVNAALKYYLKDISLEDFEAYIINFI
jgi:hypothetical protein